MSSVTAYPVNGVVVNEKNPKRRMIRTTRMLVGFMKNASFLCESDDAEFFIRFGLRKGLYNTGMMN